MCIPKSKLMRFGTEESIVHELTRNNTKPNTRSSWFLFRAVSCEFVDKFFCFCTNLVKTDLEIRATRRPGISLSQEIFRRAFSPV